MNFGLSNLNPFLNRYIYIFKIYPINKYRFKQINNQYKSQKIHT